MSDTRRPLLDLGLLTPVLAYRFTSSPRDSMNMSITDARWPCSSRASMALPRLGPDWWRGLRPKESSPGELFSPFRTPPGKPGILGYGIVHFHLLAQPSLIPSALSTPFLPCLALPQPVRSGPVRSGPLSAASLGPTSATHTSVSLSASLARGFLPCRLNSG